MTGICYYCGKAASSDEHVPPKAIFPKPKDSPDGRDYRKDLITVRSCAEHNSAKSRDDEYLLYVLAMCLPSNELAKHQFLTKVQRAIQRKPALLQALLIEIREVTLHDTVNNTWHRSIAIQPDEKRLINLFTHIAKAIYLIEKSEIWLGKVSVLIEFILSMTDIEQNERQAEVARTANGMLAHVPHKGANPEVFSYQFVEVDGLAMVRLHFYGNSKASAVYVSHCC